MHAHILYCHSSSVMQLRFSHVLYCQPRLCSCSLLPTLTQLTFCIVAHIMHWQPRQFSCSVFPTLSLFTISIANPDSFHVLNCLPYVCSCSVYLALTLLIFCIAIANPNSAHIIYCKSCSVLPKQTRLVFSIVNTYSALIWQGFWGDVWWWLCRPLRHKICAHVDGKASDRCQAFADTESEDLNQRDRKFSHK